MSIRGTTQETAYTMAAPRGLISDYRLIRKQKDKPPRCCSLQPANQITGKKCRFAMSEAVFQVNILHADTYTSFHLVDRGK